MPPARRLAAPLLCLLLAACAGSRPPSTDSAGSNGLPTLASLERCTGELPADAPERSDTLFVHPGLLLFNFDWDRSLAMEAGNLLQEKGYAGHVLEVRDRNPQALFERMRREPGREFVGIHYSMGGNPELLAASYAATRRAADERGVALRYHSIMIDPFGIDDLEKHVDLSAPEVGYLFIFLSSAGSALRPEAARLSPRGAASGKVVLLHAEDFGEDWDHFGLLGDLRAYRQGEKAEGRKVEALLVRLMNIALNSHERPPRQMAGCPANPLAARDEAPDASPGAN